MREKYVDERWPQMLDFPQRDGSTVYLCTVDDAVELTLPKGQAAALQAAYNRMQAEVVRMALAFDEAAPEAFSRYWYRVS